MSLELINTLGTVTTVVIVAAPALAAVIQLRHLRAGNQINAMLSISDQYEGKAFRDAAQLLSHKFVSALEDPVFREYDFAVSRRLRVPAVPDEYVQLRSAINLICNMH